MSDFDELDGILGYGPTKGVLGALRQRAEDSAAHGQALDQILGYGAAAPPAPETDAQRMDRLWQAMNPGREMPKPPPPPLPYTIGDNLSNALTLGLSDRARAMGMSGDYSENLAEIRRAQKAWADEHGGQQLVTEIAGAAVPTIGIQSMAGKAAGNVLSRLPYGEQVARFLSGNAGAYGQGMGKAGVRLASDVASGALAGTTGAALQSGLHEGSLGEQMQQGGIAGAVLGPVLNPLARAIVPTDMSVSKSVAQAAEKLRNAGVDVTGQQMLKKVPGTTEQLEQYTTAVAKTFGADKVMEQMGVKGITPEVLAQAKANIGQKFEDFVAAGGTAVDMPAFQGLQRSIQDALARPGLTKDQVTSLRDVGKYVAQTIATSMQKNAGNLDGISFRALTATNGPLGHLFASSDPVLRGYAKEVQSTLYDLAARAAPPDAAKALATARQQWANLKSVEAAVQDAGTRGGLVDPARVAGVLKRKGVSDEIGDLAQGARLLPRPTAQGVANQSSSIKDFLSYLPSTGAGGIGGYLAAIGITDPSSLSAIASSLAHAPTGTTALMGTLAGMAATSAAKNLGNKYVNSPAFTNALIRKALNPSTGAAIVPNPLTGAVAPIYNYGGQ